VQDFFYRLEKNRTNSFKKSKKSGYEVFTGKTLPKAPIYDDYQLVIFRKDASDRRNVNLKKTIWR
jgi:hypothetical protein